MNIKEASPLASRIGRGETITHQEDDKKFNEIDLIRFEGDKVENVSPWKQIGDKKVRTIQKQYKHFIKTDRGSIPRTLSYQIIEIRGENGETTAIQALTGTGMPPGGTFKKMDHEQLDTADKLSKMIQIPVRNVIAIFNKPLRSIVDLTNEEDEYITNEKGKEVKNPNYIEGMKAFRGLPYYKIKKIQEKLKNPESKNKKQASEEISRMLKISTVDAEKLLEYGSVPPDDLEIVDEIDQKELQLRDLNKINAMAKMHEDAIEALKSETSVIEKDELFSQAKSLEHKLKKFGINVEKADKYHLPLRTGINYVNPSFSDIRVKQSEPSKIPEPLPQKVNDEIKDEAIEALQKYASSRGIVLTRDKAIEKLKTMKKLDMRIPDQSVNESINILEEIEIYLLIS